MEVVDTIGSGNCTSIELLGKCSLGVWKAAESVVTARECANNVKS
jgi:hypothetical protein